MRISAKARYGLAAVISIAENCNKNECITIISLSEKLSISKIYLEQVFAMLKRGGIVNSTKGALGGYTLAKAASDITVYDVLFSIETSLFEKTDETVKKRDTHIEWVMREMVFNVMDNYLKEILTNISLKDLTDQVEKQRNAGSYMYYI